MHQSLKILVILLNSDTQNLKIEIIATMCPKFFLKTFYQSIDDYLRENIFFIFFGCVVPKIFIVYVLISYCKYHQNSIKMLQNPKFLVILLNFNTQTLKIEIVATICSKFFLKHFMKL